MAVVLFLLTKNRISSRSNIFRVLFCLGIYIAQGNSNMYTGV